MQASDWNPATWNWSGLPRINGDHFYLSNAALCNVAKGTVLVAPAATTHGNDMHQRFIKVQTQQLSVALNVTIPASRAELPSGHDMLFVIDSAGIPSVAKFVHIS